MAVRYDITFSGRVQGVFFRATTEHVARDFDVAGFVRNQSDGTVRCVAEGEAGELDRFVAAVEAAKAGHVDETTIRREPATGEFTGFAIRR
jgi:acylphosphatase